jgi:tetratricopeptide (TPR) repeat protein
VSAGCLLGLAWFVVQAGDHSGLFAADTNQIMASVSQTNADFVARADRVFFEARRRFQTETNSPDAAWEFGRACFDLAELATNQIGRADFARQGIAACRDAIARRPDAAPAHYYLGMNLGQLADTRRDLGALRMVKEMESEFKAACRLDERFDYAGPDRNLGLLYGQAPVLVSIGSRSKARQHLQRAVALAPDHPENRLNLLEACWKWGDHDGARRELKALEDLWPAAKEKFTGDAWAASWDDWERRLKQAREKIKEASKTLESPRQAD